MFAFIIYILLTITLGIEWYIHKAQTHRLSKCSKYIYCSISGFALFFMFILQIISKIWNIDSVFFSFLGGFSSVIYFVNVFGKMLYAINLYLYRLAGKKRWLVISSISITILLIGTIYGVTIGRCSIRTEKIEITSPKLPEEVDVFRVIQVGDQHIGNKLNRYTMLERMVETINSLEGDIVVMCGDLINRKHTELDERAMEILGRIETKQGVYSVLGNHDLGGYVNNTTKFPPEENIAKLVEKQQQLGWIVLRDSTIFLEHLSITGLEFPEELNGRGHGENLEETDCSGIYAIVPDTMFNITISHTPQTWDEVLHCGKADLTLAGHIHAMQFKIPIGKRGISPARLLYKRWSGLYEEDGKYLYINDGFGSGIPMRIGVKPEITLITIRRE